MKSITFLTLTLALVAAATLAAGEPEVATFAGGCFWCMEPPFDRLDGTLSTTSGYIGGHVDNPNYKQVSAGGTGHAEAVQVRYDPDRITYEQLLEVFWRNIDPLAQAWCAWNTRADQSRRDLATC